ncbi:site-2 protease family protein [Oceanibacterium hippocampi]|uniref:Peptidase family M50 n=1 Tax=Oceanibacterium hippocampi TaxID=745714 RepID=A0A1Y5U2T6_9PROT|nr:site-2 protease family protein [Oceanibacterium hippocampi]SLN77232.1 Peptidase family M50 [Oceanibacterium hippocampi]
MDGDLTRILYTVSVWVAPLLIAITLHEAAHGWVAWRLGDDTAKRLGRVTFNPFAHIDRFGTILLPALLLLLKSPFLFGYAKPVPVNFARLHEPRRDMVWVALAGPGINLAIAFVSALALHLLPLFPGEAQEWVFYNLRNSILINVLLAVFNMIPLPPLDGGRVAVGLLPDRLAFPLARLERYGILILLGLLILLPLLGGAVGLDLDIFRQVLHPLVDGVTGLLMRGAGFG